LPARPRLTIDIAPLFEPQWTGIPVFARRLIQSLLLHGGIDLAFSHQLSAVPPAMVAHALRAGTGVFLQTAFNRLRPAEHALIDPTAPLLFPSVKTAFNVTPREASVVHDMSTLFMPENHEPANVAHHLDNFAAELASNEVSFCVSDATAAGLAMAFPSATGRLRTLYQYADWPPEFELMDHNLPAPGLGRYAAVIGTIEPRKNLSLLIDALPHLARANIRFVVIGRKGWKVDAFLAGLTPEERTKIIFSGFVSEFAKYRLIKHAEFLVFPSLYEGFGIPALEAMSLGKPVLAARTSSLPEVIGDAGRYFDPLSPASFAAAFAEMESPELRTELSPLAVKTAAAFTWQRMAQPVVDWLYS
jgi:hypothetical protein